MSFVKDYIRQAETIDVVYCIDQARNLRELIEEDTNVSPAQATMLKQLDDWLFRARMMLMNPTPSNPDDENGSGLNLIWPPVNINKETDAQVHTYN